MIRYREWVWLADIIARVGFVTMPTGIRIFLFTVCIALATASVAQADDQTFAELLARAKAQAAAGHRSAPPGDNMIETIAGMVELAPTATTAQLEELVALLESDKPASAQPTPVSPSPGTQPVPPAPPDAHVATLSPPVNASSATALPATPVNPPSAVASTAMPAQALPRQEPAEVTIRAVALFNRGQAAEAKGDISGARRLYGSAAERGNAAAACSLGRLYDPAYLRLSAVGGVDPDPVLARSWYERAMKMGDTDAGPLLKALSSR